MASDEIDGHLAHRRLDVADLPGKPDATHGRLPHVSARLTQVVMLACFAGLWQLAVIQQWLPPQLLPAPSAVWSAMVDMLGQQEVQQDLLVTSLEVAVAMALAIPLAVVAGMALAEGTGGKMLARLANVGIAVPQSIFLPIFLLIFGAGFAEKIIFGFTHAVLVILLSSAAAARAVPASSLQMVEMYGATRLQIHRKLYYPYMTPVILQGVRLGLIFCVTGVILAEMYVSNVGFGKQIVFWGTSFALPQLLASIFIVGIATVIANQALHGLERRAGRWREV